MKRGLSLVSLCLMGLVVVVGALLQAGCEEAKGLQGLQVDPSAVVLATNGQTVVFSVTGVTNDLALPLEWTVGDASYGQIRYQSGYSATYQRLAPNGVNTISVRDQYDNEGYATIRQSAVGYSLDLTSSATSVVVNAAVTFTITTADAQPPFTWRKVSGPGTLTASSGSRSAVFTSGTVGIATIEVSDSNGASGVVGVMITEVVIDDGGDSGGGGGGAGGA